MMRFIRLAVMIAVGYWIYDTISGYVSGKRQPAVARNADSAGQWAGPADADGHTHGAPVRFRDADGAARTQMVGRGVIHR